MKSIIYTEEELIELIADAITNSLDVVWTSADAARNILAALAEAELTIAPDLSELADRHDLSCVSVSKGDYGATPYIAYVHWDRGCINSFGTTPGEALQAAITRRIEACVDCDASGKVWNNADPTSGQWVTCRCGKGDAA